MKRIFPIFIVSLTAAIVCSCSEKLYPDSHYSLDEGELTECLLGISVGDFQVTSGSGSRADVTTTATDAEKKINDIWVFQYDSDGNLLIKPRYYLWESATKEDEYKSKWPVVLKKDVSTIYVVANTGSSTWAENYLDFNTLSQLKAQTLPSAEPIQVGDGTDMVEAEDVVLPMSGYTEVETIEDITQVEVKVQRMYAKVIISAKMLASMKLEAIEVSNILQTCRVQSRSFGDTDTDANSEEAASTYPTDVKTALITYKTTDDATTSSTEDEVEYATTGNYIIYVPENIQGVVGNVGEGTQKGRDYDQNGALCIEYSLQVPKSSSGNVASYVDSKAKVYPGGNNFNNFNVKRNRIYNVVAEFPSVEYFFPTPSSNCFVVKTNSSVTFWPYVRKEKGGGYDISTYITPGEDSKTIKGVKIIWQDKDAIGDNSDYSLVKLDIPKIPDTETDKTAYLRKNTTITVKTNKAGNALIGAYNNADCTGEVLWSWHIWVTDNDPSNVGNAIRYTTYEWDEKGIKANPKNPASANRVPGYQVMPCNLGALEFVPTNNDPTVTYGPLYQWGRKDPFPTMKVSKKQSGVYDYSNSVSNIKVYDNSNQLIEMTTNGTADQSKDTELFRTVKYDKTYVDGSIDGLKYSIRNPTTFISAANCVFDGSSSGAKGYNVKDNYANNGDWLKEHDDKLWGGVKPTLETKHYRINMQYAGGNAADDQIPYVWDNYGSEKSIFDPCPTGWRVPPSDLWMGFTSTGESVHQNNSTSKDFDSFLQKVNTTDTDDDINTNNGFYMFLDGWKTGSKTFFPCSGLRLASGQPFHFSLCGNYHNATSAPMIGSDGNISKNDRVNCLHFHSQTTIDQVNVFERQRLFVYKSIAGPIRCVRDKK